MVSLASGPALAGSPLASYVGSNRVLVVSAPHEGDAGLARQIDMVRRAGADMRDRDLVIVRVEGKAARDDRGAQLDAAAVRAALSLPADRFAVVLIGKDGGPKLRSGKAISTKTLFGTIDAMPMRQGEMRRGHP